MNLPIQIFKNRLILGNCLDVMPAMPSESIDLIFTDPPYNVDEIDFSVGTLSEKDEISCASEFKRLLKNTGAIAMWMGQEGLFRWYKYFCEQGMIFQRNLVVHLPANINTWCKRKFPNAHDNILWFTRTNFPNYTFHRELNVTTHIKDYSMSGFLRRYGDEMFRNNDLKFTPKPQKTCQLIIESLSNRGDIIFDPFAGSGTILAAAKKLGRDFVGVEINPKYHEFGRKFIAKTKAGEYSRV